MLRSERLFVNCIYYERLITQNPIVNQGIQPTTESF